MDKSGSWPQTWKHVPPWPAAGIGATRKREKHANNQTSSIRPGNGPAGSCYFHSADVGPRGATPNWPRSVSLRVKTATKSQWYLLRNRVRELSRRGFGAAVWRSPGREHCLYDVPERSNIRRSARKRKRGGAELAFGAGASRKVLSEQQPEWGLELTR